MKIRNQGFSLIGVMVAAAMLGGLSLALVKLTEQQTKTQKTAETSFQIRELSSEISQLLLSSEGCKNTFDDQGSIQNAIDISAIKNRRDDAKISVGEQFDNTVEIKRIRLKDLSWGPLTTPSNTRFGEGTVTVTMEKLNDMAQGGRTIEENFPLKFDVDDSYNVLRCYGATENAVDTSKKESCELIGGTYDASADTCSLTSYPGTIDSKIGVSTQYLDDYVNDDNNGLDSRYVNETGDTMTGALEVQADISTTNGGNLNADGNITATASGAGTITANKVEVGNGEPICIGTNCRSDFSKQTCAEGEVIWKIESDGTVKCADVTCPDNRFYTGIDTDGNAICKPFPTETCPTDQYVDKVNADGSVECSIVPETETISGQSCSDGYYVKGIKDDGSLICKQDSDTNCTPECRVRVCKNKYDGRYFCDGWTSWSSYCSRFSGDCSNCDRVRVSIRLRCN